MLPPSFFARDTVTVAKDLLGREILRKVGGKPLRARIVETEAYLGQGDGAAHCSRGPTPRARLMYDAPGVIYVYFIYGNYFMLNFVTEKKGHPGAVLIRAAEPVEGLETMAKRRGIEPDSAPARLRGLTNGPAKLVMALGIDGRMNGKTLGLPHLAVARGKPLAAKDIVTATRIGISVAKELPLRFYEKGNPFVSRV